MKPKMTVFQSDTIIEKHFHPLDSHLTIVHEKGPLNENNADYYNDIEIACVDQSVLSSEILRKLTCLKMVALRCTGFDHVDMNTCNELEILVCNVPGYAANSVAEHTFALILSISRKLEKAQAYTRKTIFSWEGLQGFELYGKTLAVIGTGAIGKRTAEIAAGFNMKILAYDLFPDYAWARRYGVGYEDFDALLSDADIITISIPAMAENGCLIEAKQLNRMKKGVMLINTARGELIDSQALLAALESGQVRFAGLDVLPLEHSIRDTDTNIFDSIVTDREMRQMLANFMLCQHPNVLITPHIGWFSREADLKALDMAVSNIKAYLDQSPVNGVNL